MQKPFHELLKVNSADEDTRRRGRNIIVLALGLIALCLLFVPVLLMQPFQAPVFALIGVAALVYAGLALLARSGRVTLSAWLLITMELLAVVGGSLVSGQLSIAPFFLIISVLIASLSLRPWQIWLVLAANLVGLIAIIVALPNSPFREPNGDQVVFGGILLLGIVAVMAFLSAKSTSLALASVEQARAEVERASLALGQANTGLEAIVSERTIALQSALEKVQNHAEQQSRLLDELAQQRNAIRELSVPVIPISATTLIMPVVGALDSTRLQDLQERALQALERSSARQLILDITGVPVVDSQVAQGLLGVVQAARLLGAEVMLVGIRPEVAQSMVGLGLNLHGMATASDLQSALSRAASN